MAQHQLYSRLVASTNFLSFFFLFQEIPLSGWQIVHNVNETETVYKFHRTFKLAPGASVSVWSAGKTRHFSFVATPSHPSRLSKALIGKFCFLICFFRHWNSTQPPVNSGNEREALVCGFRNEDPTDEQKWKGNKNQYARKEPRINRPFLFP